MGDGVRLRMEDIVFVCNSGDLRAREKCYRIARANADRNQEPWMIFQDSNGNWCVERFDPKMWDVVEVVRPRERDG